MRKARLVSQSECRLSGTRVLRHISDKSCVFQKRARNLDLVPEKLQNSFRTSSNQFFHFYENDNFGDNSGIIYGSIKYSVRKKNNNKAPGTSIEIL